MQLRTAAARSPNPHPPLNKAHVFPVVCSRKRPVLLFIYTTTGVPSLPESATIYPMEEGLSRRDLLKRAVVAGAALTLGAHEVTAKQSPAHETLAIPDSNDRERAEAAELNRINREMKDAVSKRDMEKIQKLNDELQIHLKKILERGSN